MFKLFINQDISYGLFENCRLYAAIQTLVCSPADLVFQDQLFPLITPFFFGLMAAKCRRMHEWRMYLTA